MKKESSTHYLRLAEWYCSGPSGSINVLVGFGEEFEKEYVGISLSSTKRFQSLCSQDVQPLGYTSSSIPTKAAKLKHCLSFHHFRHNNV